MLRISETERFRKLLSKLPLIIQKKYRKQIDYLSKDFRYPSLHTKKKSGTDIWEARVDYHYRFTFILENDVVILIAIGMHDEGLKK